MVIEVASVLLSSITRHPEDVEEEIKRGWCCSKRIIQKTNPLKALLDDSYIAFYQKNKVDRKRLGWPPYTYSILIRAESPNERNVFIFLDAIAEFIEKSQDQKLIKVLGPIQSPIGRIRGKKGGS